MLSQPISLRVENHLKTLWRAASNQNICFPPLVRNCTTSLPQRLSSMEKVMLLLFAVLAVSQVQAAPELYNRISQDSALRDLLYELENQPRERVSNDFFDEPAMSRERLMDDLYSSELSRRGLCVDMYPRFCGQYVNQCDWGPKQFHRPANYLKFNTWCCNTCKQQLKK